MANVYAPSPTLKLLPYPLDGMFIRVEHPQRGIVLIEFQGRHHVAICPEFEQLRCYDPVEIFAMRDIFYLVRPFLLNHYA